MILWSFSQVRATMLHPGIRISSIFNIQHVATRRNWVAKRMQHVAPNIEQCCDMSRWNVAIVWLELTNVGQTMFGCVVLICYDRLAGRSWEQVFAFH